MVRLRLAVGYIEGILDYNPPSIAHGFLVQTWCRGETDVIPDRYGSGMAINIALFR